MYVDKFVLRGYKLRSNSYDVPLTVMFCKMFTNMCFLKQMKQIQIEQLECLCSEDTPATSWLPILLSHIGSHAKRSQSYKYR